jgi:hypothetical protein
MRGVLRQALVAHLAMAEEVLDDVEGVLNAGADLGLEVLGLLGELLEPALGHGLELAALHGDVPVTCRS